MDIIREKLRVLEAMYNVISKSSEWAYNSGNDYMYFIEGVVAMAREQIKEIDERPIGENEESEDDMIKQAEKELERAARIYKVNNYVNGKLD